MDKLNKLKSELSEEWNKPKACNIKKKGVKYRPGNGPVPRHHHSKEARSYTKISSLQKEIAGLKTQTK